MTTMDEWVNDFTIRPEETLSPLHRTRLTIELVHLKHEVGKLEKTNRFLTMFQSEYDDIGDVLVTERHELETVADCVERIYSELLNFRKNANPSPQLELPL